MDVEITEDKQNPMLGRREVRFTASYQGPTPKRGEVRSKLVALLNSDKELTVLDKLEPEYGRQRASGYVKVYADKNSMSIEPQYVLDRNFKVQEKEGEASEAPTEGQKAPSEESGEGGEEAKKETAPETEATEAKGEAGEEPKEGE